MRMQSTLKLVLLVIVGFTASHCSRVLPPQCANGKLFTGFGFSIMLPCDIVVKASTPAADFDVYTFYSGNKPLFHAYAGSFPRFPSRAPVTIQVEHYDLHGLKARSLSWGRDQTSSREILVELHASHPAFYLHVWYNDLSSAEASRVSSIMASIRERPY